MSQVFVTGGSGFIGRVLIARLVKEGHAVRALVRSDTSDAVVRALGAEPVRGDVTDSSGWRNELGGVEVVFHLAAESDVLASRARQELITVEGTRTVLEAAQAAGVPRFVHCGSEAALLAGDPLVEIDETAPLRPDSEAAYPAVKAASEAIVLEAATADFVTVSIRPRFVWGSGSVVTDGLVEMARSGRFAWIDGGRQIADVTFVENTVEGLILGWHRGRPGQAYFVTDQHRVVFREFMEKVFAVYGVDTSRFADLDSATAAVEMGVPFVWFLGQECTLRIDKAVAELGYAPVVSQAEGFDVLRAQVAAR